MSKAYYTDDLVTLYHGDCREILPTLTPASIDAVVTDPPYEETTLGWDRMVADWLGGVAPLLRRSGSVWFFTSMRHLLEFAPSLAAWRLAQDVVWEKHNGSGLHADRFKRVHEFALHLYPADVPWADIYNRPQYVAEATARTVRRKAKPTHHQGARGPSHYTSEDGGPKLMRSVIYARSCHGYAVHPTQKPIEVVAPLVETSCPPRGTLLDCFAGSGTSLVYAKSTGRMAIGIEKDATHCAAAADRLAQEIAFGGAA